MIFIRNRQRTVPIDRGFIQKNATEIVNILKYEGYDLSIVITNDRTMRTYNRTFRQKDKTTDILSFPFYSNIQPGKRIISRSDDEKILGDLIISAPAVVRDAAAEGISFDERMQILLVHGILHLLGYDHITDGDYKIMHARELRILRYLKKSL